MHSHMLALDAAVVVGAAVVGLTAHRAAEALADCPIPGRPAVTATAAAVMAAIALAFGTLQPAGLVLGWALLALALVDAATLRLPDIVNLPLIGIGLGLALAGWVLPGGAAGWPNLLNRLAGAALGYAVLAALAFAYRRSRGHAGLGMGDAKLAAAGGAWLGAPALPVMVLIGCGIAFAWAGIRWLRHGRATLHEPLPFGPPLAAAIWLVWVASRAGGLPG